MLGREKNGLASLRWMAFGHAGPAAPATGLGGENENLL
jgi:hypothetical protein